MLVPSKEELNSVYVNLKQVGVGGFASDYYWSSTEGSNGSAWSQYFSNGEQYDDSKLNLYTVRAVRAF
jgi:hypothetical protein